MSRRQRVFQVAMTFAALVFAAWIPQPAQAFGVSGGSSSFGFTHNGITVTCTYVPETGTVTANPGNASTTPPTPATWSISVPQAVCTGTHSDGSPAGSGDFSINLTYQWSTAGCNDNDANAGIGNNLGKTCDLQNPKHNGGGTGQSLVSCDNQSPSTLTYSAFCESGMMVSGTMTWLDSGTPPQFTTLDGSVCVPGNCTMKLGGFPLTKKGTVDTTACATIFPTTSTLGTSQVLLYKEVYPDNSACIGPVNPQSPSARSCDNESYDPNSTNPPCNPVTINGTTYYHSGSGSATTEIVLTQGQWQPNNTINLKCSGGTDNGQIPTVVSNSAVFDTTQINIILQSTPQAMVDGYDNDRSPVIASALVTDSSGNVTGTKLSFNSCRTNNDGLAQVICRHSDKWTNISGTSAQVVLRIRGNTQGTSGAAFTGITFPVNINDTDACPN